MKYLEYIIILLVTQSMLSQNEFVIDYGVIYNQTQADDDLRKKLSRLL